MQVITLLYMAISIADFLTVFAARTHDYFFWHSQPHWLLMLGAVLSMVVSTGENGASVFVQNMMSMCLSYCVRHRWSPPPVPRTHPLHHHHPLFLGTLHSRHMMNSI